MSTRKHWQRQHEWSLRFVRSAMRDMGFPDVPVALIFKDPEPGWTDTLADACLRDLGGRIRVSRYWWSRITELEREELILHETAHIITALRFRDGYYQGSYGYHNGHGPEWQAVMVALGQNPERFYKGHAHVVREISR